MYSEQNEQDVVLSQGVPRNVAVNFGTYQRFQRHRAVFTAVTTLSS